MPESLITRILLIVLIGTISSNSQPKPPELQLIVANVQSLPVEYKTDILLYLIDSGKIRDSEWKMELLENIFTSAEEAKSAYEWREVDLSGTVDSVSSRLGVASRQKLDRLSIQSRVIQILLNSSPLNAKQWMTRINKPDISSIPCSSPTVTDPHIYYETVTEVFRRGFSKTERLNGDDVAFLRNALQVKASVDDLIPLAQMIQTLPLSDDLQLELVGLFNQYLTSLTSLENTDRQFSYAEHNFRLSKEIQKLMTMLGTQHLPAAQSLLTAYQKFLVAHLSGRRCQDTANVGFEPVRKPGTDSPVNEETSISFFNAMLKSVQSKQEPLVAEKLRSQLETDVAAEIEPLNLSPLNGLLGNLSRKKIGKQPYNPEFDNSGWENRVLKTLDDLEAVSGTDDKCPRCTFHERTLIYTLLIDVLDGYLQTRALNSLVTFLAGSRMQQDSPMEWLAATKLLLRFTRPLSQEQNERLEKLVREGKELNLLPVANGQPFLERMQNSGSPILATYAHLEIVFPQPFDFPW